MTDDQPTEAMQDAMRLGLRRWGERRNVLDAERDPLVIAAVRKARLAKEEVHILTGLGRNTIDRILRRSGEKAREVREGQS